ncbi:hypothetical protein BY996DRAFT_6969569, partial [Phakopsora pachyrhizi]
ASFGTSFSQVSIFGVSYFVVLLMSEWLRICSQLTCSLEACIVAIVRLIAYRQRRLRPKSCR